MKMKNYVVAVIIVAIAIVTYLIVIDNKISEPDVNEVDITDASNVNVPAQSSTSSIPVVHANATTSSVSIKPSASSTSSNSNGLSKGGTAMLIAKKWFWTKTIMNDGKIVTPKQPDRFALLFAKEGRFTALTDCNNVGGEYKISNVTADGGNLQLTEMMSTLMYCEGSQEQEFNKMLSESGKYMFDKSGRLILLLNYDSGSVIFEGR